LSPRLFPHLQTGKYLLQNSLISLQIPQDIIWRYPKLFFTRLLTDLDGSRNSNLERSLKRIFSLALFLVATAAFAETCSFQTYASSWMATGTPFSVKCPSATYNGTLVATPARRFFHRGHLMLKFDQPVMVHTKKESAEGKIEPGRGKQIAMMLMDGGVGIGAKDITDGLSGVVYKSWYAIPIGFVTLSFFSKGGDVNLKPGDTIEVTQLRAPDAQTVKPSE
jgi:hypothetical protein